MASNEQVAGREDSDTDSSIAGEAKQSAREIAGAAKEAVRGGKSIAAEYIQAIATAIDSGAGDLRQKGRSETASLARSASDQLGTLAQRIADSPPRELFDDLQAFVRRQPALCFGMAALAGFGLVRFLKSSADRAESAPPARQTPASETWRH